MLAVTDGSGNVLETYTHGADLSGRVGGGAGGIGGILASTQEGGAAYYHYDFNGNVVNVSTSNQTQLAKYTYGPFGEVLLEDGLFDSRYQFSTKEYDSTTGLNYYGHRFYSLGLGRWINRDPIEEEEGWQNHYALINNGVTTGVDYLGLRRITIEFKWVCAGTVIRNCTSDPAKDCNKCPASESFSVTGEGESEREAQADAISKAASQATDCGEGCKADYIPAGLACAQVPTTPLPW